MITTVLFDLDGTLVDTAPDLGFALNLQLKKHGKPMLSDLTIRPVASHGSRGLIGLGFGVTPSDANFLALRDEYLNLYDQVFTRSPKLFDGMDQVLRTLEKQKINWGIVTNKPRRFTQPLVQSLGLHTRAVCVVSGDDAAKPKPSPETLMLACKVAQVKSENCIYIGDAARDIEAGKAAGMKTAVALFGYIDKSDKPQEWGADTMIQTPADILQLI
ncbi:MAG: HAD family hydrolase [Methylophilaceae bacterium]